MKNSFGKHLLKLLIMEILLCGIVHSQQFTKIKTINELGGDLFFRIWGADISDSILYFSDNLGFTLYKYNLNNGKFKKLHGKGRGPGEFITGPREVISVEDRVVVMDGSGVRYFHLFDKNIKFIERRVLNGGFHLGCKIRNLLSLSLSDEINAFEKIDFYDKNLLLKGSITPPLQNEDNARENLFNLCSNDSLLFLGYKYKNLIQIYNIDNKKYRNIRIKNLPEKTEYNYMKSVVKMIKKKIPPQRISYFANWPKGSIIDNLRYWKKNILIVQLGKYTENPYRDIIFLSIDGKIIGKQTLEEKEKLLDVSEKFMVTTGKDDTELNIYKIEE